MENFLCINCKHYLGDLSCNAFEEIPVEILEGTNEHSEPLTSQENKIIFENKKEGERNLYFVTPDEAE